jgi:multiple sugar transport system ATP-binding protein
VREAAVMLGLEKLLERRPKALSGGQRQRVAVGRAIVRQPKVFLFDEPLSNLDAKMRVQTRAELVRLHRRLNATMIYVTHDQAEAMTMGDRIVVMRDGRVQQIAAPMDIYTNPTNAFVAGFIGSPPMNFVRCRVAPENGNHAISSDEAGFGFRADVLPEEARRGMPGAATDVLLGIRPENIRTTPAHDGTGSAELTATVELIEPMGAEQFVTLRAGSTSLIARLDPDEVVHIDSTQKFFIHLSKARLFDPETESALAGA